ncbi:PRC-barrel domain-containing protein [Leptolyngbya sp. FACHB-541]|uniref:PRC-barrel domain-containing protein n=1 Tax=Leptolyngbya sp. FACHB-541 TaxID=2692810 RepID=UPI001689DC69|nr:PRC-barrel domain-containing protein [Leptolyngbya sp. FACHB-541]MBD2000361.1 PRC-barrel domain-containing protein [Leptolyngbya sp. FACHB-541]
MTSEQLCQRSDLLGTQVITRSTGKRLGVISQLWVDIDRREVVALGLRESMLSGVLSSTQQMMLLDSIRQIGDVILVDDETVLEDAFNAEAYSALINSEVITETGELLGKVRGFKFNTYDGRVVSLIIASIGLPMIPDQVISTYELSIDEVVSTGPDRLIVFEGAEEKMNQLTVGVLERLGIGKPPWDRDEDEDYYVMPTSASNQLGTGARTSAAPSVRLEAPIARETWDDDNWSEAQPAARQLREPLRQRQPEPAYYDDDVEEDNWGGQTEEEYTEAVYIEQPTYREPKRLEQQYDEVLEDAWADDENPKPYRPPQINIPEKRKVVEYEEEADY